MLLCLPCILTCSATSDSTGLTITLGANQVTMINASSSSCAGINSGTPDTAVAGVYFSLQNMSVAWTKTPPLTIQWIQFSATTPAINGGQPFSCMIASTDLLNAWVQRWNVLDPTTGLQVCGPAVVAPQDVTITASSPNVPTCDVAATVSSCPFKCGGITMTNPKQSSSGAIQVEIYATYPSGGGNLTSIVKYETMTFFYQGN